jgi:hypothetical protein
VSYLLALDDAGAVRSELDAIGEVCLEASRASEGKGLDVIRTATSKETEAAYVEQLPHVERMLTVELDLDKSGDLGLGRINKHDAPPRTGEKLRKQLRRDGAVEAIGKAMEMLLLAGFSAQAGLTTEPALARGRSPDEVWTLWNGLSFPFYAETDLATVLFLNEPHEPSIDLDIRLFADRGLDAYVEAGEEYGFVDFDLRFNVRRAAKTGRAMTFAYLAVSAGRALHRSLTEAVGE